MDKWQFGCCFTIFNDMISDCERSGHLSMLRCIRDTVAVSQLRKNITHHTQHVEGVGGQLLHDLKVNTYFVSYLVSNYWLQMIDPQNPACVKLPYNITLCFRVQKIKYQTNIKQYFVVIKRGLLWLFMYIFICKIAY